MIDSLQPIPLVFWRSSTGREPVRDWLNDLPQEDRPRHRPGAIRLAGRASGMPPVGEGTLGSALIIAEQAGSAGVVRLSRRDAGRTDRVHQEKTDHAG